MTLSKREIEIPRLQFVAAGDLVLHEQHDASRTNPLAERLRRDRVLKNPPVVAPINGDARFVVLDGANRTTALAQLGVPHVVVQVVDYDDPELVLDTWYHLVAEIPPEDFCGVIQNIPGIRFERVPLWPAGMLWRMLSVPAATCSWRAARATFTPARDSSMPWWMPIAIAAAS